MQNTPNIYSENKPDGQNVMFIQAGGTRIVASTSQTETRFIGISPNHEFFSTFNDTPISLLTTAINNRTRERNYFRLLSQYLSQEISEEDFEKEIDAHEDLYVVDCSTEPTYDQFETACLLAKKIIGIESQDDFMSLFSFSEEKSHKLLTNGND